MREGSGARVSNIYPAHSHHVVWRPRDGSGLCSSRSCCRLDHRQTQRHFLPGITTARSGCTTGADFDHRGNGYRASPPARCHTVVLPALRSTSGRYVELPLFAGSTGWAKKLLDDRGSGGWETDAHVGVTTALRAVHVNRDGPVGLYDSREARTTARWSGRTALMLAADAGFAITGVLSGTRIEASQAGIGTRTPR